jgi:hypothetical protein
MPLLGTPQEVAKKRAKTFLLDLPTSRRFTTNGGDFYLASILHLRGIYPTPQMGL